MVTRQGLRRALGKKMLKGPKGKFELMPPQPNQPDWMTRVFRNNHYTVMIDDYARLSGGLVCVKAMIQRHDDRPMTRHWRQMQDIKNEIFGPDTTAIEFYPAESELVDDHNIYWLWVIPDQPIYKRGKKRNDNK